MISQKQKQKIAQFNNAQIRAAFYIAKIICLAWGRGTGKSTFIAWFMTRLCTWFPGATISFTGKSYINILEKILPPILAEWKKQGYIEGYHYVIGKPPLKWWKDSPIIPLGNYGRSIVWYTGTVFQFISLDKNTSNRGQSYAFNILDEACDVDYDKYQSEVAPSNRGHEKLFGKVPLHHGYLFSSSKPFNSKGLWFPEFGNYYEKLVPGYWKRVNQIIDLKEKLIDADNPKDGEKLWRECEKLLFGIIRKVGKMDRVTVYYDHADAFDNIENVGLHYFRDQLKIMSRPKWKVEILNRNLDKVDNGYYPNFDHKFHVYDAPYNYSHIDVLGLRPGSMTEVRDSRWDEDVNPRKELILSCDWGDKINFLLVGQRSQYDRVSKLVYSWDRVLNIVKSLYVKKPLILDDVFKKFCVYYQHHKEKHIKFYYDHTGNSGIANDKLTFAEQAAEILINKGWDVDLLTDGAALDPDKKYTDMQRIYREDDDDSLIVRINADNNTELISVLPVTEALIGRNGVVKDKSSEDDPKLPQEYATHGTDAHDIMVCSEYEHKDTGIFVDLM